jgi:hypothetical protein
MVVAGEDIAALLSLAIAFVAVCQQRLKTDTVFRNSAI